jgi:hypothetical protein
MKTTLLTDEGSTLPQIETIERPINEDALCSQNLNCFAFALS